MIVTLTTSLPFVYSHASLKIQGKACTPTKSLNRTQMAITSGTGTFEQQWGLDATGNWKTVKQDNDGNFNTMAICDITGLVGERYAYSA